MKSSPVVPGGSLTSKPTWSNTPGCSATLAFFFASPKRFPVYEIVVRFRQREEVIETVDSLEIAWARVQAYKCQRLMAYFRPTVRRISSTRKGD
jgi:hypothetical protein